MKIISVAGILLAAVVVVAAGRAGPDIRKTCGDRGLLLTISVPEGTHRKDERIPLTLNIANTSQDRVHLPSGFTHTSESADDRNTVTIGSGTFIVCQVQSSGEYLTFKGAYAKVVGTGQTLKAGEEIKAYTVDLAKCFDLKAGKYDAQLLFTKRHSGFIDAASNRITITVE